MILLLVIPSLLLAFLLLARCGVQLALSEPWATALVAPFAMHGGAGGRLIELNIGCVTPVGAEAPPKTQHTGAGAPQPARKTPRAVKDCR